jgi:hypothetical protein
VVLPSSGGRGENNLAFKKEIRVHISSGFKLVMMN